MMTDVDLGYILIIGLVILLLYYMFFRNRRKHQKVSTRVPTESPSTSHPSKIASAKHLTTSPIKPTGRGIKLSDPGWVTIDPSIVILMPSSKKLNQLEKKFIAKPTKSNRKKLMKDLIAYFKKFNDLFPKSPGKELAMDPEVWRYVISGINALLQQLPKEKCNLESTLFREVIFRFLTIITLKRPNIQLKAIQDGVVAKVIELGLALCNPSADEKAKIIIFRLLFWWHDGCKDVKHRLIKVKGFKKIWNNMKKR